MGKYFWRCAGSCSRYKDQLVLKFKQENLYYFRNALQLDGLQNQYWGISKLNEEN